MSGLRQAPWIAAQLKGVAKEVAGSMLADEELEHEGKVLQAQAQQASDAEPVEEGRADGDPS